MKSTVAQLGSIGMITDRDAAVLPPNGWTSLLNVRCTEGRIEPIDGYSDITSWTNVGSADVYAHGLIDLQTTLNYFLIYPYDDDGDGQAEAIYQYNGTTDTDITRLAGAYTGTSADLWNTTHYNGLAILNNGSDAPQYWDGVAANCENLKWDATHDWDDTAGGGETYRAKVIRSYKNFLIAIDIDDDGTRYSNMVHWSSIADPGNVPVWDYNLATEESGRVNLTETGGRVLDGVPLGQQFVIYKEDSIYIASFVGGQFVLDIEPQVTSHGLWAANCAVDIGGRHVVLGDGVVYTFDGHAPNNILKGKVADDFFAQIDPENYQKCFLTHSKAENEVWFCFPEIGKSWATKALIWNYRADSWYYRTIPPSSRIRPGLVVSNSGDAWDEESTLSWDDEVISAWEERTYSPIGDTLISASDQLKEFGSGVTTDTAEAIRDNIMIVDPTTWFLTRAIWPVGTGGDFEIGVGKQDYVDGPVTWEQNKTFSPGDTRKINWRVNAPIQAIRVSFPNGVPCTFNQYTIDQEVTGGR